MSEPRPRRKQPRSSAQLNAEQVRTPAAPPPEREQPAILADALEWSHNPWVQHPAKSAAALAICIGVAWLAGQWMNSPLWALIGFLLVGGTNSVLFIPVRYRLDSRGVTVWFLGVASQREWTHYRNAYFHKQLVHLTTMPSPSPLDPFRGHALLFDPASAQGSRELVKAYVQGRIAPAEAAAAGGGGRQQ